MNLQVRTNRTKASVTPRADILGLQSLPPKSIMWVSRGIPHPFIPWAADHPPLIKFFFFCSETDGLRDTRTVRRGNRLIAVRDPAMSRENAENRVICLGRDCVDTNTDNQARMSLSDRREN